MESIPILEDPDKEIEQRRERILNLLKTDGQTGDRKFDDLLRELKALNGKLGQLRPAVEQATEQLTEMRRLEAELIGAYRHLEKMLIKWIPKPEAEVAQIDELKAG